MLSYSSVTTRATTQAAGDNSTLIATDAFVTTAVANAISGVNPAVAVQAATVSSSDTSGLTYNNGVSGIGATFTGSNNTALTIDGYTFTSLGQRLLVKNDTQSPSGAFNGIYYLTQLQLLAAPPILTRALDYDSPSDINNTGAIPVVSGTVNGSTSWVETAQIIIVGTTPLTFTQFTLSPTTLMTTTIYDPATIAQQVIGITATQTLTNKRVTPRVNTVASSATPTINTDTTDIFTITALAANITSMTTNLSGTPTTGQQLLIRFTDNGTARSITWGTSFESSGVATLLATTVINKDHWVGLIWDEVGSKWVCLAVDATGY